MTGEPWRRTAQHCGEVAGDPDICCDGVGWDWLHVEVKANESFGLGTKALRDAYEQSERDAEKTGRYPVVLWKLNRKGWRLSWMISKDVLVTTSDIGEGLWYLSAMRENNNA